MELDRRDLLRALAAAVASAAVPGCAPAAPALRFLTPAEAALWTALADTAWPPRQGVRGAGELGAAHFLDLLLSALDDGAAPLFRKADGSGMGLDRVQAAGLRLALYGSSAVPYANASVLGPVRGLRDQVREGLADAASALGDGFAGAPLAERVARFKSLPAAFRELVIDMVCQSNWAAPAYGGNREGGGWADISLEAPGQPTGYSLYDAATETYVERPGLPVSTPDAGPDPAPLDDEVRALLDAATAALGGRTA